MSLPLYEKALVFAAIAHKDQKRWSGDPYITHPIRVAGWVDNFTYGYSFFSDYDKQIAKTAAILHDTVEDCGVTLETITQLFGEDVAKIVSLVTRQESDEYLEFINKILPTGSEELYTRWLHSLAALVKRADLKDNTVDLRKDHHLWSRYRPAIEILTNYLNAEFPGIVL